MEEKKEYRRRGGRPKKSEKDKVNFKRFDVWFSEQDYNKLLQKMEEFDMKPIPYIRKMALEGGVVDDKFRDKSFKELITNLHRVGGNINQITRRVNVDNKVFLENKNTKSLEELKELLIQIINKI